jgi:hypothetical protein
MTSATRLVSIPDGEDVVDALRAATSGIDGWVQAAGVVEGVELRVAGEGTDPTRALRGRLTLASLVGPAGGPYGVTLARATDSGLEVIAGELLRARSAGVIAVVLPLGAAVAAAKPNDKAPEAAPPKTGGAPQSPWAKAALTSAAHARANAPPEIEQVMPLPGDLVQHFAFGLCEVLMGDDERLKIRDVSGPGRLREILLDMLVIRGPSEKDGKRLFRLERRS